MFGKFFTIELKCFFRWIIVIILLFIVTLIFYFVQTGINNYKSLTKEQNDFQDAENLKGTIHNNFIMYGAYGIQFYLMPDTSYILCQDSNANMAYIDSGARLSIFENKKNKHKVKRLDFKDIISFIPYLIFLYGFHSNKNEYNRFLKGLFKEVTIFFSILVSKALLTLCVLFSVMIVINVQAIINSISFGNLIYFWLAIYSEWFFFLSVGIFIGLLRNKIARMIIAILFCAASLVIPYFINESINEDKSYIKAEILNLKDLMGLEKRLENEFGINLGKKDPAIQEKVLVAIESGQKIEYKNMVDRERMADEKFIKETRKYQRLSAIFPTSFIITMFNEISSIGDISLWEFNKFTQQKKRAFIRYYIDKLTHFIKIGESKINQKIFKDNNVFASKRKLPYSYHIGLFLSSFYTILISIAGFCFFKKTPKSLAAIFKDISISLIRSEINCYLAKNKKLIEFLLDSFHEKRPIITIDNECISTQRIIYLPELSQLPFGAEKFLNMEVAKSNSWKEYLIAAFNNADIVITTWNLDEFSDDEIETIKSIADEKVYLNIGFSLQTWLHRSKNRLSWKDDPDIKKINPF